MLHLRAFLAFTLLHMTAGWCRDWGRWSSCSHSCGGGTKTRSRGSFLGCGNSNDKTECNEFCYNGGKYTWGSCHCPSVATGRCCENLDYCLPKPCQHRCSNSGGAYKCSCYTGYYLGADGKSCHDTNECSKKTDHCSGTCINTQGSYRCECSQGFELASDKYTCLDKNECDVSNGGCQHICINTKASYHCQCRQGFDSDDDNKTCSDIDECSTGNSGCAHDCINVPGSFNCVCNKGYRLQPNMRSCIDIDECAMDNGACSHICNNAQGSFSCECRHGYRLAKDDKSCIDIDECKEKVSGCAQNCYNVPGGYNCSCETGYELNSDGNSCDDVNDCVGVQCEHGGSCIDKIASYSCICMAGYTGEHCELDFDECAGFLKGGCEDLCVNTEGSFRCECSGNRTLSADGYTCEGGINMPSVFERHDIVRNLLPRGCFTVLLTRCSQGEDIQLVLSSTSPWYQLLANNSIKYTNGIVFAEINSLSMPISISGLQVSHTPSNFQLLSGSLLYSALDGFQLHEKKRQQCLEFDITPRDIHEFLSSESFLRSFYNGLESVLPEWLRFSDNGSTLFEINGIKADILHGKYIKEDVWCRGAPVFDDHFYTVLKFSADIKMTLYGEDITLPKSLDGHKACFIIDICQDYGGTVFLMLPKGSRDVLGLLTPFQSLWKSHKIKVEPHGLGISLSKDIKVLRQQSAVRLWKGDEMFDYPLFERSNFWIGGDMTMDSSIAYLQAQTEMFLSVPTLDQVLYSVFFKEWEAYMNLQLKAKLQIKFRMAGKQHVLKLGNIGNAKLESYASLGGLTTTRRWCGIDANPSGLFLSLVVDVNPFQNLPILTFLVNLNTKVYVFVTSDPAQSVSEHDNIDILKDILQLDTFMDKFINVTLQSVEKYSVLLTNESNLLLQDLTDTAVSFKKLIVSSMKDIEHLQLGTVLHTVENLWHSGWSKLTNDIENFIDSIEFNTRVVKHNFTELLHSESNIIKRNFKRSIQGITDQLLNIVNDLNGVGLRFEGSLKIFGLEFAGLKYEFVYSVDKLGSCGKFKDAFELLQGQKSVRVFASVHGKFIKLCPFLSLDVGAGLGVACSIETPICVVQFHAQVGLLGIKVDADVFIDHRDLHFYLEGNIWNYYKAVLHVSAGHGKTWNELHFIVTGKFVANADHDGKFDDSYLAGLRKLISDLGNGANKRLSMVQESFTKAQDGMTKAQNWLTDKQKVVRGANKAFDDAVKGLEYAKQKLEDAKKPFQKAIEGLNRAQKKVDNLCRIKSCSRVCVPGIKCKICHKKVWFVRIPYPCCHFTHCMFSFPNPLCVVANLACRGIRAIAYVALEAAKVFVRIPMAALDIAKGALSIAQVIVDKSRVVLDIAVGALEIAKFGLEGAKGVLEVAKYALEGIKVVVRVGINVFDMIVKYGLQSLIDVKDCGFEVELSTHDKTIFAVSCQVNALKLGWKTVGFTINFKDPIQSLWQAAKATIKMLTNTLEKLLFGRKRREIYFDTISSTHRVIRALRNKNITDEDSDFILKETIDVTLDTTGYRNTSGKIDDAESRINIFQEKCLVFKNIFTFFSEANDVLIDIVGSTASMMNNASAMEAQLNSFNISQIQGNMSLEHTGINPEIAMNDYNISSEDLASFLADTKQSIGNDPLMLEISSVSEMAKNYISSQTDDIDQFRFLDQWLLAMENTTNEYFDYTLCISFLDCAHFAISELYDLFYAINLPNTEESRITISVIEDLFLDLTENTSRGVREIQNLTEEIASKLHQLDNMALFCSKAPVILSPIVNQTASVGTTVNLLCNATGDPVPTFWWFIEDKLIPDQHGMILTINATTALNNTGVRCMAGNIVANRSSEVALLLVEDADEKDIEWKDERNNQEKIDTESPRTDSVVVVVLSVTGSVVVAAVVGSIVWRTKLRQRFRKSQTDGSFASLNMVRPVSAAKPVFLPDKLK